MAYYRFSLPLGISESYRLIKSVCEKSCTIKREVPDESIEVKTKFRMGKGSLPFVFYLSYVNDETNVFVSSDAGKGSSGNSLGDAMARFNSALVQAGSEMSGKETIWDLPDKEWSDLIEDFCSAYPDFPLGSGKPTPVAAEQCDDGIGQEAVGKGKNISLGRAAVGGALFGGAGALVGGMSGMKRNITRSRNVFNATMLFRVLYSNGRLIEKEVKKNSREYAELMAKSR